jgi:hypothetical protein
MRNATKWTRDVRQARTRGRLDSTGELYRAGDWLLVEIDGIGGLEKIRNYEWDEDAAKAAAREEA